MIKKQSSTEVLVRNGRLNNYTLRLERDDKALQSVTVTTTSTGRAYAETPSAEVTFKSVNHIKEWIETLTDLHSYIVHGEDVPE